MGIEETKKALKKALKANKKYDDGTVIRFTKTFAFGGVDKEFQYAAIWKETTGKWWTTGTIRRENRFTNIEMMEILKDAKDIEMSTVWESVS